MGLVQVMEHQKKVAHIPARPMHLSRVEKGILLYADPDIQDASAAHLAGCVPVKLMGEMHKVC